MRKILSAAFEPRESLLSGNLHKLKYLFGLILCLTGINLNISAAPTDRDPTFGTNGVVFSDPDGTRNNLASGMALQADGKIVMVSGRVSSPVGFIVARYNADGSLDQTFGTNGWVATTFGGANIEAAIRVAVQTDGKIVIGGHAQFPSPNNQDMAVMRLNSNGSVDTAFAVNGVRIIPFTDFNGGYNDYLAAMKIANDGKIVIGGSSQGLNVNQHASLARLNTDGSFDTTFGGNGRVLGGGFYWNDLVILPDGSIVTAGYISQPFIANRTYSVKFNPNGSQAWSYIYGQDGVIAYLFGIAAQTDGKFVIVGQYNNKITIRRLNADGSLDNSFSNDALVRNGRVNAVAIQPDGKIVATASLNDTPFAGYNLIRLNADGTPDSGFGGGVVSTFYPNTSINGSNVIIQPDGKILVGGSAQISPPQGYYFTLSRYLGGASAPVRTLFDYDGDGRADVSVFRPSENKWFVLQSSNSGVAQPIFGAAGDVPAPADFDGDGKTDVAIFRASTGTWWYLSSVNNTQNAVQWGAAGDIARPSDFDGDGKSDFVVYRPSENRWYRLGSAGGSSLIDFGSAGDKPVIGDFDGDGKSDPAIYRPSTGVWWYAASGSANAQRAVQFGISTDTPVPADYDGDGKTDFAVYRASDGGWHILRSANQSYFAVQFGTPEDKPVAADYDGDGKADIAVFRPSNGSWYLLRSTSGFTGLQWGAAGDTPTENAFVP